jgi:hypothetical protein
MMTFDILNVTSISFSFCKDLSNSLISLSEVWAFKEFAGMLNANTIVNNRRCKFFMICLEV